MKSLADRRRLLVIMGIVYLPLLVALGWGVYFFATNFADSERLHWAARTGNVEVLNRVLDAHPDWLELPSRLNQTPLQNAADHGQVEIIKVLIRRGADVNAHSFGSGSRYKSLNALHEAAIHGHTPAARVLIEAGADVNAKTAAGYTPLDLTDVNGEAEMARFLTDHGGVRNLRLTD